MGTFFLFFYPHLRTFFSLLLERKEGRERNIDAKEKHWLAASHSHLGCLPFPPGQGMVHTWTRVWIHNPSMSPDLELNLQPFGYGSTLQPTEPHWLGLQWELYEVIKMFYSYTRVVFMSLYTGFSTNNAPVLLQNILLQNHKHVILQHNNITLKHTIWHFRWNVQIKTINYYTRIITLPTTLKQVLFLLDPVY